MTSQALRSALRPSLFTYFSLDPLRLYDSHHHLDHSDIMSSKLDQSLDTIMTENKSSRPKGRRPQRGAAAKAKAALAPTGGVQKTTKAAKPAKAAAAAPRVTAPISGDSKVIVSNLPLDVTETLLKVR